MSWETELDQWTAEYLPDLKITNDEPMSRHTSFRVGGPAKRMAFPASGEQLVLLLDRARECGARPLVIGNGTNLLAPDEGLFPTYSGGCYDMGGTALIVSRGLARESTRVPRLYNPPELVIVDLN